MFTRRPAGADCTNSRRSRSDCQVRLGRFFRTPKGLAIVVIGATALIAALGTGVARVAPGLSGAVLAAMVLDAPILRMRKRRWVFPDGALLTGLIVAMVLSPYQRWYVAAVTAAVGVASK